ncbi:MAG: hypothetical protein H6626_10130 [Pseudobdellovibrionaceae bacterium]|nr:hypothetical protein [Bdellovibrionales bacterium]USN46570.1 MAG: hypothetical protein H6626_10130 [Pseudobdellovibrionaceae bacterium]
MLPIFTALSPLASLSSTTKSAKQKLRFPVSLLPFLIHAIEKEMKRQFSYLSRKKKNVDKIYLKLSCEYEGKTHFLEISAPHYEVDFNDYLDLIENQLSKIDLSNPITHFELQLIPKSTFRAVTPWQLHEVV